jgi:hypothetical protein
MNINSKLLLCLALVLSGGLCGCSTTIRHSSPAATEAGKSQDVLVSFPNRLKPGEQIVGFGLDVQNGRILTVAKVPYNWIINMYVTAPMSGMSGFPNEGAGAFQNMAPLQQFVTVHRDRSPFRVIGYLVLTRNFSKQWTNFLTTSDFVLERTEP